MKRKFAVALFIAALVGFVSYSSSANQTAQISPPDPSIIAYN